MYILHLSDLHFGNLNNNAERWYGQLSYDLKTEVQCPKLDVLIISGDIANSSTEEEYQAAQEFINQIRSEFKLQRQQIIIVPGNHDLNWQLATKARFQEGDELKVDIIKYQQRFDNFRKFYQAIKKEDYPLQHEYQGILYHLPEQQLLILGLNSAWRLNEYDSKSADIHPDAINNALNQVLERQDLYKKCLKIAVWHHPLSSASNDYIRDHGFLQRLVQAEFRLALHGHIHKAETSLFRYDFSSDGRRIDIICAGTFGAATKELVPGYPWQYNLLKLEANKLIVETRRREEANGTWKADARWSQGQGQDPLPRYEIELFSSYNLHRALADLSALAPDADTRIKRIKAARWLCQNPHKSSVSKLAESLETEVDPEAKYWITMALGYIGSQEAKDVLGNYLEKLDQTDSHTRLVINDALFLANQARNNSSH